METWTLTITDQLAGRTLEEFVGIFHVGEKKKNKMKQDQLVQVNNQPAAFNRVLQAQDTIKIDLTPFEKLDFIPESVRISVLYEDDWIMILDKQASVIVYPESKNETGTLVNRIANYYKLRGIDRQIRYLHRLDRDTTGCFAVAKNFLSHSYFSTLWDHKQIERTYLALVEGKLEKPTGTITAAIGRDRHVNNKYRVSSTGDVAVTDYELVKEYGEFSLVRLRLITGKTHQIRVHMAYIGHPLLGDETYGGTKKLIQRTALHSETITFPNPLKNTSQMIRASLPADMASLVGTANP
jgi:23S rRNA pseudouridine1911/1915/1917 synthase